MATWGLIQEELGCSWNKLVVEMRELLSIDFPLEDDGVHINSTQTGKTVGAEFLLCSDGQ